MSVYIPHAEFHKLKQHFTLDCLKKSDWVNPRKGQITEDGIKKSLIYRYVGNKCRETLVYIAKNVVDDKHYITFSPTGDPNELSSEEGNIILQHFKDSLPHIKICEIL